MADLLEGLLTLLLIALLLSGPIAFGYLGGNLYPIEVVRRLMGLAPAAPAEPELRQVLRLALGAPATSTDLDLVAALYELRREADRAARGGDQP